MTGPSLSAGFQRAIASSCRSIWPHPRGPCGRGGSEACADNRERPVNLSAPFHPSPGRDLAPHAGGRGHRCHGLPALAGRAFAAMEFPTIQVSTSLPGASPEVMASAVATPLEKQLGIIPGVTQLTSSSSLGNTQITIQFGSGPQYRCCRTGRSVRNQCCSGTTAKEPAEPAHIPESQSRRPTDPPP